MTQFCVLRRSLCQVQLAHQVIPLTMGWTAGEHAQGNTWAAGASRHSLCSGLLEQSLHMPEGEVGHQKGKHSLAWTSCTVFRASAVRRVLRVTASDGYGATCYDDDKPLWPWDGVGVGGGTIWSARKEGKLCVLSSGSHDHNLTKADAVCSRNY